MRQRAGQLGRADVGGARLVETSHDVLAGDDVATRGRGDFSRTASGASLDADGDIMVRITITDDDDDDDDDDDNDLADMMARSFGALVASIVCSGPPPIPFATTALAPLGCW